MDVLALLPPEYALWVTVPVAVAAALATVLPEPKGDGFYKLFHQAVQFVAFNFGKAKTKGN